MQTPMVRLTLIYLLCISLMRVLQCGCRWRRDAGSLWLTALWRTDHFGDGNIETLLQGQHQTPLLRRACYRSLAPSNNQSAPIGDPNPFDSKGGIFIDFFMGMENSIINAGLPLGSEIWQKYKTRVTS